MFFIPKNNSSDCFFKLMELCVSKNYLNKVLTSNQNAVLSQWVGTIVAQGSYIPTTKIIKDIYNVNNLTDNELDRIPHAAAQKIMNIDLNDENLNESIQQRFLPSFINILSMGIALKKEKDRIGSTGYNIQEKFNAIKNSFKQVKMEFVTILGIFSAIVFAMFGGIGLYGNVFKKADYLSSISIGNAIFIGSIYLFGIYLILLLLLLGIFKIVKPNGIKVYNLLRNLNEVNLYILYSFFTIGVIGILYSNNVSYWWIIFIMFLLLVISGIANRRRRS